MSLSRNSSCYFNVSSKACIMYADTLILLSASVCGLQRLFDTCTSTGTCLQFNDKKSQCIVLGLRHRCQPASVSLLGKSLLSACRLIKIHHVLSW